MPYTRTYLKKTRCASNTLQEAMDKGKESGLMGEPSTVILIIKNKNNW